MLVRLREGVACFVGVDVVGSELGLKELVDAAKFTKHRLLGLRRQHNKRHKTEHGNAPEPIFFSLHDVALSSRVRLNHASLRWFGRHSIGRLLVLLVLAELLFKSIAFTITGGQHATARVANRVAGQRSAAAVGACTHVVWLGWDRITIVHKNPLS